MTPSAPFFRKVRVAPLPAGLRRISARTPSPKGIVETEFVFEGEGVRGTVPVAWDAANGRLYAEAISYTGEAPGIGYLKVTTAGGADSFGVEFVSA